MNNEGTTNLPTGQAGGIAQTTFSLPVRIVAYLFSYILHPLFIPLIATWYLAFIHEGYFAGISPHDKIITLLRAGFNTIIFPFVTILLLKAVGFIKSIFLKTRRERVLGYVTSNIFYFWAFWVFRNQPEVPSILTAFILGVFLSSCVGLFANTYYKISMHALGMGTLIGLMLLITYNNSLYPVFSPMMITLLLTGLVCTSRLIISDHSPFDIYTGVIFGIICQAIAGGFIGVTS